MALLSPETDPATYFGFTDLNGFKDFVVYAYSCSPDLFPSRDWLAPDMQMNLGRAFTGLRYGLDLTAKEINNDSLVVRCRKLVDEAYELFRTGRDIAGQNKLEEVEFLLKKVRSKRT